MPLVAPTAGWGPLIERVATDVSRTVGLDDRLEVGVEAGTALGELLDLVLLWNRRIDLTAARSADELVDLFVGDAVLLAALRRRDSAPAAGQRWVDVGSGGGAPGLALAVLAPDLDLTLVEPRAKRVAFLRTVLGTIGRESVHVERARSEQLPTARWEVACSRATLPPAEWLGEGARLATRGVWLWLARAEAPRLPGWRADVDIRYTWPLTGATRRALRFVPEPGASDGGARAR